MGREVLYLGGQPHAGRKPWIWRDRAARSGSECWKWWLCNAKVEMRLGADRREVAGKAWFEALFRNANVVALAALVMLFDEAQLCGRDFADWPASDFAQTQ